MKLNVMMHNLYLDTPRWFYSHRATDWKMKLSLAQILHLGQESIPSGVLFSILYNAQFIITRFLPRSMKGWFVNCCVKCRALLLQRNHVDVLIAQGGTPPMPANARVIWETYFLDPQLGEQDFGKRFERGCDDYWMRCMDKYGKKVFKIGVRGNRSVALVKQYFPELSNKVIDLGFVHEEYDVVADASVVEKQKTEDCVTILFIGRQARLKGIECLLRALRLIRNEGVVNFKLRVVSTFRDGIVNLPLEDGWIEHVKEVGHAEALKMFRDAQIFAMPTMRDSYGLVFHEALANGCVTCVPRREPQMEFVDYGKAGVVLNPFSDREMADSLKELILNKELRIRLALAGKSLYLEKFSQKIIRERWNSVIKEALYG